MSTAPTPSSSDDAPAVLVETRPGVVRLTLNRPAKGNALGLTMAREVLAAIAAAEADESVHVLTLTGAGRIFCGGGDVQAMAAAPAGPERRAMIQELGEAAGEVAVALTGSRLLVLAGVNGTAAGAGLGLLLGGDVVLVREDAQLVTAFSALGMTPDTGVSYWLPRVLGPVRATQLLLGGRRLNGAEAVAWGLATEAVAGDAFAARLAELEDELVAGPAHTYGPTKALARGADVEALRAHVRQEAASSRRRPSTRRPCGGWRRSRAGEGRATARAVSGQAGGAGRWRASPGRPRSGARGRGGHLNIFRTSPRPTVVRR